jgi:RimJ/RimL family protein N-acetyltransferase
VSDHPVLTGTTGGGEIVTLRPPHHGDIDAVVSAFTDPDTLRWTLIPYDFDAVRAEGFVANAGGMWDRGEGARWVVADSDDTCVALFDLHTSAIDPEAAEVFFVGVPASRGKGYVSTALRVVAEWAINERGIARVEWQAIVGNDASKRVATKAGFVFEGILRLRCNQRGTRHDSWVASLTRDDIAP